MTPLKKDTRRWHWGSPGKAQPTVLTLSTQPLLSLLSHLAVALSPNCKMTIINPGPSPGMPHNSHLQTIPSFHKTNPAPIFNTFLDICPAKDGKAPTLDKGEGADPDEEDSIHGNCHHVRVGVKHYHDVTLTFCSLPQGLTSSFSWDTLF